MSFPQIVLEAFRAKHEVRIETTSPGGDVHTVVIWIVVVVDAPYVRSVHGANGRWFRELMRTGQGAVHVGPRRIAVRAKRVTDTAENARVSEAIRQKYVRSVASLRSMIRDEVLATTARLEPA